MATKNTTIGGRTSCDADAPADRLSALILQLDAATAAFCGEGFDTFDNLNEDIKQNYLWMVHDLATRARFAHHEITMEKASARAQA